jgi:phosphomannomutase
VESINCPDEIKFQVVESLKPKIESLGYKILALDGIKAFGDEGWLLIRASNTNPTIRVNAEGKTDDMAKKLHALALDAVSREIEDPYRTKRVAVT